MGLVWGNGLKALRLLRLDMGEVDRQLILENVGPVQAVLDAHDGVVNVIDTTDGIIMMIGRGLHRLQQYTDDGNANLLRAHEIG